MAKPTQLLLVALLLYAHPVARAAEHAPLSIRDLFPESGVSEHCGVLSIEYLDQLGGTMQSGELDEIELRGDVLTAAGDGYQVTFSVQPRDTYLVLRIKDIMESKPGTLMKLAFRLPKGSPFILTRLDYMSVPHDNGKTVEWPWIWARAGVRCQVSGVRGDDVKRANPLGAFAIQRSGTDEQFDVNLLRMWVHEGLPHPVVDGEWTLEKARTWLTEWQARFSDQSCLVISAKDLDELDTMTDWAAKLGMKRIYLHTDTWRGEYWPMENSYIHVNTDVFPRGEKDLNAYTSALRRKGLSFAVHSTCISIGRNDPDYVRNGLDPRLSRWVRGTLERDVSRGDTTLLFRPEPGSKYPQIERHGGARPNIMPSWMNLKLFLLGDELVEAGVIEQTDQAVWILKHCRRGSWGKTAAAHKAGATCEGMTRSYGQAFVPDPDSTLFPETIRRWADFCSRNNVDHLECDALENHADKPWGVGKFSWLLTSHLKLPSTSNTSGGRPLPFQVEYWFRGSRNASSNHARAGVAGGASLPLYLHSDIRQATGPYEILFKPGEMVAGGGNSFNVSYPWPMFGVTPELLASHGMVPEIEALIADWRAVLPDVTPEQRGAMAREYTDYRGAAGRNNQHATDVLFRPEILNCQGRVIPLRLVGRVGGELNWGFGQEFGPIVPRQYVRVGETIALSNAYHAQEPEFVVRVMGQMEEAIGSQEEVGREHFPGHANERKRTGDAPVLQEETGADSAIEASYATGTTTDFTVHPLHAARHIWPAAEMHNGEAKPGKVDVRCEFEIPDLVALKRARLILQVDDEAVAFVNNQKVFAGGRYDQALFVDLTNLRQGKNVLRIKATNYGAPGCVTAALHLESADGMRVLSSDTSWQGRPEGGAWGPVADLGAYGDNVWPKAEPQLSVLRADLMPNGVTIEPAQGHELTVEDGALQIASRNASTSVVAHVEDRPAWATLLDMSEARGIGCTVTGDGSDAVLVITIGEHHKRDYVIPIDFTGTREIEIPSGEVAWGDTHWGWRWGTAKFDYSRIRKVRVGFGTVPPETHAKVTVSNIRPLRKVSTELQDLTIRLGTDHELVVPGTIRSEHYLWYRGGDTVGLYDLNWNKVRDMAVTKDDFIVPAGELTVELDADKADQHPWFEVHFFTRGKPLL
ncbi:MAG: hypothetical protein HN341_12675 [Verrucomicrobia bacterium]|nr:hypothetical protein [Verrucomicrobiota bacterium]